MAAALREFSPDAIYVHKMADLDVITALVTTYCVPRASDPNLRSSFSDRNLIIYAGQIIREKGVDVLLEALAQVKSKLECIILGDGNHKAYCEELSRKLGLADRVHLSRRRN